MFLKRLLNRRRSTIAVQNSFPNQAHTAENEFVRRLQLCAERLSIDTHVVNCSTEVSATGADFLLSLHEVSPKLTPTLTIGAMWNPPSGIRHDPIRCDFVGSFDGYLSASPSVTRFIKQQTAHFSGPPKPIADFRFFPTSPTGIAQATSYDSLAYLGVHWDGARHGDFLDRLIRGGLLTVYGPPSAWGNAGSAYRGTIPFDGTSVIRRLAEHGIVLCLHREPHIAEDTPSMRLFEAASAGCLILTDAIPFAEAVFGDTVFVLPDSEERPDFVQEKLAWARANPARARDMARASQAIFEKRCSLDVLLPMVVAFGNKTVRQYHEKRSSRGIFGQSGTIDVILDLRFSQKINLSNTFDTINKQTYRHIRIIILARDQLKNVALPEIKLRPGVSVIELALETTQSVWASISKVLPSSEFIAKLDERTTWAASHLTSLVRALYSVSAGDVAQSSTVISVADDTLANPPNFSGETAEKLSEHSILLTEDYGLRPPIPRHSLMEALFEQSNWLLRTRSLKKLICHDKLDHGKVDPVIRTGQVTCFVSRENAHGLRPITFC